MSNREPALFTIGQFAALHEIHKKTLMWYDEIGLFRPAAIHEENGYRLYSYFQSAELETILLLRDMKVSLGSIREFMQNRSAESMSGLLNGKIQELDESIRSLQAVRSQLSRRRSDMVELVSLDPSEICLVEKEPRYLATVRTGPQKSLEEEIESVIEQTKKHRLPHLYQASYGSMLPVESLYEWRFTDYTLLFLELPNVPNKKGLHKQPGGTYLRAYCKGSWDNLPLRYEAILQYAEQNHLRLCGFAYETGVNEMVIDRMDDYLTRIEIPVCGGQQPNPR